MSEQDKQNISAWSKLGEKKLRGKLYALAIETMTGLALGFGLWSLGEGLPRVIGSMVLVPVVTMLVPTTVVALGYWVRIRRMRAIAQ